MPINLGKPVHEWLWDTDFKGKVTLVNRNYERNTAIAVFFYAHKISNSSIAIQMDASRDA